MRRTLLILLLLIAGCSQFKTNAGEWTRPNATDAQTSADLDACRRAANASVGQDAKIQQDMSGGLPGLMSESSLQSDMNHSELRKRYRKLVDDCMEAQGYVRGAKG
jgi:hypothetical protein